MIIVKENGKNTLAFQRDGEYTTGNYSIMVQNTVTKEITTYTATDKGNPFYYKFDIDIQLEVGEYYVILFQNPDKLRFYAPANAPKDIDYVRFLVSDGDLVMNGKFYLVLGTPDEPKEEEITYLKTELMRVGDYKKPTTQYQKEQQYIQYNG